MGSWQYTEHIVSLLIASRELLQGAANVGCGSPALESLTRLVAYQFHTGKIIHSEYSGKR